MTPIEKDLWKQSKVIYPVTDQEKNCQTERFFKQKMREEWVKKKLAENTYLTEDVKRVSNQVG